MTNDNSGSELIETQTSEATSSKPHSRSAVPFVWRLLLLLGVAALMCWGALTYLEEHYIQKLEQTITQKFAAHVSEHANPGLDVTARMSTEIQALSLKVDALEHQHGNTPTTSPEELSQLKQKLHALSDRLNTHLATPQATTHKIQLIRVILNGGTLNANLTSELPQELANTLSDVRSFPSAQDVVSTWIAIRQKLSLISTPATQKQSDSWSDYAKAFLKRNLKLQKLDKNHMTKEEGVVLTVENLLIQSAWSNLETFLTLNGNVFDSVATVEFQKFKQLVSRKALGERLLTMVYQQHD